MLVAHINSLEVFLLESKFNLLITEFLAQTFLFFVEMQEHLDISIKLILLLSFNNLLDVTLSKDFLASLFKDNFFLFENFVPHFSLELSELLGFLLDMLMHPKFHLVEVLFIYFSCLI